ncbi:SusC/RagA family TonB-linked outer membrane protein [Mucilaginibacter sp. OK098]|uniref:SusC/RagA family TonB-linked outer membrane protein n=1 Tax=Mucilaginibacter sp. OK098 TaxID=1855297 RepID=UPI001F326E1A|nr:SusC/RagA family TonB-linked outer membrane protein [Mucilaginibacter sp. OK098]
MKITTFLLLISVLTVSASSYAQKITLNEKKAGLDEVLAKIRQQSGYDVIYSNDVLEKSTPVTIKVSNVNLEDALKASLLNQPLTYEIEEKTILIKMKEPSFMDKVKDVLALIDVHGRVVDEKGNPLPGVTVKLKDESQAMATDKGGYFTLKSVNENAVIVISSIGYLTKEIRASAELGTISLEVSSSQLDAVQVIAYGTTSKRFSTSNIGSIIAEDIQKQPVGNLALALQGRIPGLYIQQNSGNTIGNVRMSVQGKNSLLNGSDPFYVVDGVPYPNNNNSGLEGGITAGGGNSTLNFLNPADIESVEILKDADATAIYGSRAANGAILITTKRGKAGETKVDLNMQSGWGKITKRTYDLMNTEQYVALRKEAIKNGGATISSTDYDVNGIWDQSRNTDWQKELAGGTAYFTNLNAAISGGNENTQFRAGAGYTRQTTVYPGDFSNYKNNVLLSVNHHSTNQKFTFNLSGNYLQDENNISTGDLFQVALTLAPDAPALFNRDGSINWSPLPTNPDVYTFNNPAKVVLNEYRAQTSNLIANSNIGYKILPGLEFKTNLGYNKLEANVENLIPITYYKPDGYKSRGAAFGTNTIASWIIEPQLTYSQQFSFGHVEGLLGSTFQQSKTNLLNQNASGFNNDAQLENIGAASTITVVNTVQSLYRYSAIFGRINYRLKDRYIINLSARRDGSSRFGSANMLNSFYSAAGAWIFSEEPIMKFTNNFLSFGKLHASYGTTGNDQIGDYNFLSLYNNQNYSPNYQNTTGLIPAGLSNPYLQWEETKKLNIGLDLGFFTNQFFLNVNYFRNRSSNQLVSSPLPITTGFTSIRQNLPATVQNTGWELTLDATPYKNGKFNWQISANFTLPKNKLIAFPNLEKSSFASLFVVGQSITITKAYKFEGVNPQTGFYQFLTADGKLVSNPSSLNDKTQLLSTDPKWYGGISNRFSYKGFELSFLLQFVKHALPNYRFGPYFPGFPNLNLPANFTNRWQKNGDNGLYQQVQTSFNFITPFLSATQSDAAYSDATFMRLKNASLSYTIPNYFLHKIHIANARVYFQGQNLLTISNYIGDPETGYGTLPPLRVFSLGLQLTF